MARSACHTRVIAPSAHAGGASLSSRRAPQHGTSLSVKSSLLVTTADTPRGPAACAIPANDTHADQGSLSAQSLPHAVCSICRGRSVSGRTDSPIYRDPWIPPLTTRSRAEDRARSLGPGQGCRLSCPPAGTVCWESQQSLRWSFGAMPSVSAINPRERLERPDQAPRLHRVAYSR